MWRCLSETLRMSEQFLAFPPAMSTRRFLWFEPQPQNNPHLSTAGPSVLVGLYPQPSKQRGNREMPRTKPSNRLTVIDFVATIIRLFSFLRQAASPFVPISSPSAFMWRNSRGFFTTRRHVPMPASSVLPFPALHFLTKYGALSDTFCQRVSGRCLSPALSVAACLAFVASSSSLSAAPLLTRLAPSIFLVFPNDERDVYRKVMESLWLPPDILSVLNF